MTLCWGPPPDGWLLDSEGDQPAEPAIVGASARFRVILRVRLSGAFELLD
jgi:hypothetical protein